MIISHKYNYIFFKPAKVAGTSIEVALASKRGKDDIITPLSDFDNSPQNYFGFYNHIEPKKVKKRIKKSVWDNYFKFTVVRNPWDLVVSRYWWERSLFEKKNDNKSFDPLEIIVKVFELDTYKRRLDAGVDVSSFDAFLQTFPERFKNTRYYFDSNGSCFADYYIRYENLHDGFRDVTERLGLGSIALPKFKVSQRKTPKHYSEYYNEDSRQLVRKMFQQEVDFFGYKYENN